MGWIRLSFWVTLEPYPNGKMADPNLVSWCEPDFVYTIFVLYFRHTQICFIFKAKPNWILKISKLNLDFDQVTPLRFSYHSK